MQGRKNFRLTTDSLSLKLEIVSYVVIKSKRACTARVRCRVTQRRRIDGDARFLDMDRPLEWSMSDDPNYRNAPGPEI